MEQERIEPRDIYALSLIDTKKMVAIYQQYLAQQLGGTTVFWMAFYRGKYGRDWWQTEMMDNWKVVDVIYPVQLSLATDQESKKYFKDARTLGLDPQAAHGIEKAGTTRVHLLRDAVDMDVWQDHWMRKLLLSVNVGERIVGVYNLSPESESVFLVDRPPGAPEFTREDADIFYQALIDFPRLHYCLMLERGLLTPAAKPFSPRQFEVVKYLLGPLDEKQIAERLNLSKGTVHNHVTEIYKNLSVSSRYEMTQLWLGAV